MNKMQWSAAVVGAASILVLMSGVAHHASMAVGPEVETAPGVYAQEFVDETVPGWVVLTSAALLGVAGVLFYKGGKQRKS